MLVASIFLSVQAARELEEHDPDAKEDDLQSEESGIQSAPGKATLFKKSGLIFEKAFFKGECTVCDGTQKILKNMKKKVKCPVCDGTGKSPDYDTRIDVGVSEFDKLVREIAKKDLPDGLKITHVGCSKFRFFNFHQRLCIAMKSAREPGPGYYIWYLDFGTKAALTPLFGCDVPMQLRIRIFKVEVFGEFFKKWTFLDHDVKEQTGLPVRGSRWVACMMKIFKYTHTYCDRYNLYACTACSGICCGGGPNESTGRANCISFCDFMLKNVFGEKLTAINKPKHLVPKELTRQGTQEKQLLGRIFGVELKEFGDSPGRKELM